jgi:hypothetical protein
MPEDYQERADLPQGGEKDPEGLRADEPAHSFCGVGAAEPAAVVDGPPVPSRGQTLNGLRRIQV